MPTYRAIKRAGNDKDHDTKAAHRRSEHIKGKDARYTSRRNQTAVWRYLGKDQASNTGARQIHLQVLRHGVSIQ